MPDWFELNAPKPVTPAVTRDWFSQNSPGSTTSDANQALSGTGLSVSSPQAPHVPGLDADKPAPPRELRPGVTIPDSWKGVEDRRKGAYSDIGAGVAAMSDPSMERKAHGLHQALGGATTLAAPAAIPAMAAAPVAAAVGIGLGMGTQKAVNAAGEWAGVPEGYRELAGDAAGVGVGAAAFKGGPPGGAKPTAKWARKSAQDNNYEPLLYNTSKKPSQNRITQRTAKWMSENPPTPSSSLTSLQKKMADTADSAAGAAGTAYDNKAPLTLQEVAPIFNNLDRLARKQVYVKGSRTKVNPKTEKSINLVRSKVAEQVDRRGNARADSLDDLRDKLFAGNISASGQLSPGTRKSASAIETSTANAIRTALRRAHPDAEKLVSDYSNPTTAAEMMESALLAKKASQRTADLGTPQNAGHVWLGNLPTHVTGAIKGVGGFARTVPWNTTVGWIKSSLANYLDPPVAPMPGRGFTPPGAGPYRPGYYYGPPAPAPPQNTSPLQLGPASLPPGSSAQIGTPTPSASPQPGAGIPNRPPIGQPRQPLTAGYGAPPQRMGPGATGGADSGGGPAMPLEVPQPVGVVTEPPVEPSFVKGVPAKETNTGRKQTYSSEEQKAPKKRTAPYGKRWGGKKDEPEKKAAGGVNVPAPKSKRRRWYGPPTAPKSSSPAMPKMPSMKPEAAMPRPRQ